MLVEVETRGGVRFYEDNMWIKDELYKGNSESYAEDFAENYVKGKKMLGKAHFYHEAIKGQLISVFGTFNEIDIQRDFTKWNCNSKYKSTIILCSKQKFIARLDQQ